VKKKKEYYVYVWYYEDDVVYVGKGKGDRYKHGNSGCSQNYCLNEIHFTKGSEKLKVDFLKKDLTEDDALHYETVYINTLKPKCNIAKNGYLDDRVSKMRSALLFKKTFNTELDLMKANITNKDVLDIRKAFDEFCLVHTYKDILENGCEIKSFGFYKGLGFTKLSNISHALKYRGYEADSLNKNTIFKICLEKAYAEINDFDQ
jgi:hypothetical protein